MGLALSAATCGGRALGNNATDSGITGSGNVATAPTVTSTTPGNDATGVNRDSTILINFSVSVNAATVTMTSNTTCTGSVQVSVDNFANCLPMNQTITQSGTQVTVRMANLMAATTAHRVRITTAVAGVTGLTMTTQYETSFTTGTNITPLTNEFGTDCSGGAGTISAFKTAATGTEGAVGPIVINGLIVTGIDRFGSFYLQKGTEGIYVDVNTTAGACGGPTCQGNKASHYGMQVGDEICLSITRAVESNNVDTVKDYDAIKKTGIGAVTPAVLTDAFAVADISEWVRISGFLTTKTSGGNVNHTLTFADGKTIIIRDNSSNKFTSVNQNDYVQVTTVSSWFASTPQLMVDTGVGTVSTGLTAPSYSVTGTVSGWRSGENFTLTLNGSNATVISANGAFSFTGSPTVSGQYTVAISVNPPNDVCTLSNATGFATTNISSVGVSCTPKPMYQMTSWAASEAAGTYPLAMQFYLKSGTGTDETALVTVDTPYTLSYTSAYNLTSGARLMGKDADGFSFFNSGSTANTYLGTAVMTLDTTGKTGMRLNWTGRSVTVLARPYRVAVQTRVGTSGAWTNTGSFYAANATAGHSQTFSAVDISALDNQLQGQIRFVYYQEGAGSGNRPELAVDDVVVYSPTNAKPWLTGFSPAVSATGVSVTPTISVTFNKSMNTGTVTTGNLYIVAGTNCSNTAITAAISTSNSDRTFTFSPTGLSGSTQYSTCVKAAIADTTGDTIGTDRMISWTTVGADVTPPANPSSPSYGAGNGQVTLGWTNPADGDFAGIKIVRADGTGTAPADCNSGTTVCTGTDCNANVTPSAAGLTYIDTSRTNGTQYAYRMCAYDGIPNMSAGVTGTATPSAGGTIPAGNSLALWTFETQVNTVTSTHANISSASSLLLNVDKNGGTSNWVGGCAPTATNAYTDNTWNLGTAALALADHYYEFSVTVQGGFSADLTALNLNYTRSATGAANYALYYSVDSYAAPIATGTLGTTACTALSMDLTALANISGTVTFRLTGYGASASTGTWRIDNVDLRN